MHLDIIVTKKLDKETIAFNFCLCQCVHIFLSPFLHPNPYMETERDVLMRYFQR